MLLAQQVRLFQELAPVLIDIHCCHLGPIAKNLGRSAVCQDESKCKISSSAKSVPVGNVEAQLAQVAKQLQEAETRGLTRNITFV